MGAMHLPNHGKMKLQLRESNARSKNSVSALKLKARLTTLVSSKHRTSGKSRKSSTKDQAGARFTTMITCTMNSSPTMLMETSSVKPATSITNSSTI